MIPIEPKHKQLQGLVQPYLDKQPWGLAFAIGYASPSFANHGNIFLAGNAQNQFGSALDLDRHTLFEIASVSKTFTATLYALLIRSVSSTYTLGNFIYPNGPLRISSTLAGIPLDDLMSYTSGLPTDNMSGAADYPPYLPQPYSLNGMLSYLDAAPPSVGTPGQQYAYSNLAFAIMASILGSTGGTAAPTLGHFEHMLHQNILEPLSMRPTFFNRASLARLPLGYEYNYSASPVYAPIAPGWVFFPAYYGAGGIVATPQDMFHWLLFNMGITQNATLSPLLAALQSPPAPTVTWDGNQLGLGWFISSAGQIWKDGDLDGCNSYIAFLRSPDPGNTPSQAGVFVLVNADGLVDNQDLDVAASIANDVMWIMQGQEPPADKSRYPRGAARRRRKPA
jgi:D-alanyl-D-alanine-carboxypeptidase/D-alanyl-D-alanine-endopeptidase